MGWHVYLDRWREPLLPLLIGGNNTCAKLPQWSGSAGQIQPEAPCEKPFFACPSRAGADTMVPLKLLSIVRVSRRVINRNNRIGHMAELMTVSWIHQSILSSSGGRPEQPGTSPACRVRDSGRHTQFRLSSSVYFAPYCQLSSDQYGVFPHTGQAVVPQRPGVRELPDQCLFHRPAHAIGTAHRHGGFPLRPVVARRGEMRSATPCGRSCRFRHEGWDAEELFVVMSAQTVEGDFNVDYMEKLKALTAESGRKQAS